MARDLRSTGSHLSGEADKSSSSLRDVNPSRGPAENVRPCTCHPDDNPPRPCPQRFAYSECVAAAALPSGGQWRPIITAPEDGTKVLLKFDPPFHDDDEDGIAIGRWLKTGSWWLSAIWASTDAHRHPSHWMPLPAPPSAPCDGSGEADETEGLSPEGDSAVGLQSEAPKP